MLLNDTCRGQLAKDLEDAGHRMENLDWDGALQDLSAAAKYLKTKGCQHVGITGFCMGGALSFAAAVAIPSDISAVAPFYGIPDQKIYDLTKIIVPVQMHFAMHDITAGFASKADYDPVREKLTAAGVDLEFHEYDAGHAFTNSDNPMWENYDKELTHLAMNRLFTFLEDIFC